MAFAPVFGRPFAAPFDRRAAVVPWWLLGGVSAGSAVAVYQPKGAASLAASYVNLANPGTYDAAPGTAPTFDAATGWTFTATSSQYLTTGVTPASVWSLIVQYKDATVTGFKIAIGNRGSVDGRFYVGPSGTNSSGVAYGYGDANLEKEPVLANGNLALAANQPYRNGSTNGYAFGIWTGSSVALYIGCRNWNGTADGFFSGKIQAVAIYSTTLTATQVGLISTAMAAL